MQVIRWPVKSAIEGINVEKFSKDDVKCSNCHKMNLVCAPHVSRKGKHPPKVLPSLNVDFGLLKLESGSVPLSQADVYKEIITALCSISSVDLGELCLDGGKCPDLLPSSGLIEKSHSIAIF